VTAHRVSEERRGRREERSRRAVAAVTALLTRTGSGSKSRSHRRPKGRITQSVPVWMNGVRYKDARIRMLRWCTIGVEKAASNSGCRYLLRVFPANQHYT
jgi:hypothetical protein